jgi:sigma-B regulation protein RsbU (phosphoserine phosphatase)
MKLPPNETDEQMLLHLTDFSDEPLHGQICQQLAARILAGDLRQGAALKPAFVFAREQRVSVSTVERAYRELASGGLISYGNGGEIIVKPLSLTQKKSLAIQQLLAEAQESRWLEEELVMAQKIQASLLPQSLPDNTRFQVAAHAEASRPIGGDFYDHLPIDEDRFGLIIADACGKGLPAAMLISQIQAIVKNEVHHGSSIRQTMQNLNRHVRRYGSSRRFVTMFYGSFDDRAGILEFANAGHHPPILLRKNGEVEFLKTTGPALNIIPDSDYQIQAVRIKPGDAVLFYTDGVTETMNGAREEFGEQRLLDLFIRHRRRSAQDIIRSIIDELSSFCGSAVLPDDRTLMVMKVLEDGR